MVGELFAKRTENSVFIINPNPSTLFLFFPTNHGANFNKFFRKDKILLAFSILWCFSFLQLPSPRQKFKIQERYHLASLLSKISWKLFCSKTLSEKKRNQTKIYKDLRCDPNKLMFFAKKLDNVGRSDWIFPGRFGMPVRPCCSGCCAYNSRQRVP